MKIWLKYTVMIFTTAVFSTSAAGEHTHNTAFLSLPEPDIFQTASVWFLPDFGGEALNRRNNQNNGHIGAPDTPPGTQPRDCAYYGLAATKPAGQICKTVNFGRFSCYKDCRTIADVCHEENANYTQSCPEGWAALALPGSSCSFDSSYSICCNLCADFPLSGIPEGYEEVDRCESCYGTRYKIKPQECPAGYQLCVNGPAASAKSCRSGEIMKYNNCQPDPAPAGCPAGSYDLTAFWCNGALRCWLRPNE